ncbi:MAG: DUF308 domain-containing protein [Rhodospirillales bacterium]|nr:DUF308 domain-containing protein [Rhodospirillales bacterium]
MSDPPPRPRSHWTLALAFGAALIALGAFAWFAVVSTGFASPVWIGAALLCGGLAEVGHARADRDWGMYWPHLLAGALYGLAGLALMVEPQGGTAWATAPLAVAIAASGLLRMAIAVRHWHLGGAGLLLIGGGVGIGVGAALWLLLPWPGLWVPGSLIAVELIVHGAAWFEFGLALRRLD